MNIAVIGRGDILPNVISCVQNEGHKITCIITAKEAPEYNFKREDYEKLARSLNIPFSSGPRLDDFAKLLINSKSDIAVSINYTGVISQQIIDIFPFGILNAHGGDLPRYRGNACQAWAILNGEDRIGLCIHRMIGGELDSGDIIARDYISIDLTTKVTSIWEWMNLRTPDLMLKAVRLLDEDPLYVLEQQSKDPTKSLRCYPRMPEDGRIDWAKSAVEVLRLINASNKPYSGAFCDLNGEKLIIWDAELVVDEEVFSAIPGQVTKLGNYYIEVACGKGKVRILMVEKDSVSLAPSDIILSLRQRLR